MVMKVKGHGVDAHWNVSQNVGWWVGGIILSAIDLWLILVCFFAASWVQKNLASRKPVTQGSRISLQCVASSTVYAM